MLAVRMEEKGPSKRQASFSFAALIRRIDAGEQA